MEKVHEIQQILEGSSGRNELIEFSLSRVWQHHNDRAFVILTSWRGDKPREENEVQLKALMKQIRSAGFGFVPLEGVGQEVQSGKLVSAVEPSILVPAREKGPDDGSFISLALKWAKAPGGAADFAQDYIFYANPDEHGGETKAAVIKVSSGATDFELSMFSPSTLGQFYSRLRSGRTFKYESAVRPVGVKYSDPPASWIHGMGLESAGQIRFDLCETLDMWKQHFNL